MRSIDDAVLLLRQGEIVGVPTETVYGLAVDPRLAGAISKLYEVKGRPQERALSLLVASLERARHIARFTPLAEQAAREHWPGPLTMVLHWSRPLPTYLGDHGRGTVGLRVPDHPVALSLLEAAGPLAVTSANRSGEPPAIDHTEAETMFGAEISGYLEGSGSGGAPSTVVDFTSDPPAVLRRGPVTLAETTSS